MTEKSKTYFLRDQMPAVVWAILIFIASSIPANDFPDLTIFQYDKLIHLIIFLIFGLLIYRAFNLFWETGIFSYSRALVTLLTVAVYGILDEFHQQYVPGRTPDIWDATADALGGIVGVILIYIFASKERQQERTIK